MPCVEAQSLTRRLEEVIVPLALDVETELELSDLVSDGKPLVLADVVDIGLLCVQSPCRSLHMRILCFL